MYSHLPNVTLGTGNMTITFSNPNILNPTVSIPTGVYQVHLQLTATSLSDSTISAADEIIIDRP